MLTVKDAPCWLKNESLRNKWADINNARLKVWLPADAPLWMSARWKRDEWAQSKNEIEIRDLTYLIPCICDKCKKQFTGIEYGGEILDEKMEYVLGCRRRAIHFETDCILCKECSEKLVSALQDFEKQWVCEG